jgi:hypothetical protein
VEVIRRWWWACVLSLGALLEEVCFRLVLAAEVLIGRTPRRVERRWWNRATESPVLVDVFDWTTERLLFSVLVWPPLESAAHVAERDHRRRLEEVLEAIGKGAAEKMWSTCWQVSELVWDNQREVWVDADGHAYDGERLYDYSRGGVGGRSY